MFEGSSNITWNEPALQHLLNDPKGDVGRHMRKIGLEILGGAKAMVGVRTGKLRRALYFRQGLRGRVQYVQVGADVKYARTHHDGTDPHVIRPRVEGRLLRFNVGGRVVYAKKVNHPGNKPNPYLTVPMRRAVRR